MLEIARDLGVTYGVVSGVIQRNNIGLPEDARERIEQTRRAKCRIMAREKFTGGVPVNSIMLNPVRTNDDGDGYVFDIEARGDAWDEVGEAYMAMDDSY